MTPLLKWSRTNAWTSSMTSTGKNKSTSLMKPPLTVRLSWPLRGLMEGWRGHIDCNQMIYSFINGCAMHICAPYCITVTGNNDGLPFSGNASTIAYHMLYITREFRVSDGIIAACRYYSVTFYCITICNNIYYNSCILVRSPYRERCYQRWWDDETTNLKNFVYSSKPLLTV